MYTNDIEALEQHLLYHKALAESPEEVERINGYLSTLNSAVDGTKLNDPVDEAIRRMFVMVLEDGFDPWAIDLEFFVETYSKKIEEDRFDILVAGKFIYWAWRILGMQVSKSIDNFNPVDDFDDVGDGFEFEDEDSGIVVPDLPVHDVDYSRVIERTASGPITMSRLYNGSLKDSISFFVSVLHLVRYGLLEVEQESLPRGEITISVIDPTAEVPLSTEA